MLARMLEGALTELRSRDSQRLALLSFVFLYYELVCIRWASAFVLYLSYYANIVLLACFLGMGLGLLAASRRSNLINWFPVVLLAFLALTFLFQVEALVPQEGVIYFTSTRAPFRLPAEITVGAVFVLVALQFMLLSQEIGRLFARLEPLRAYAINILASIAGILAFALCSWLALPSSSWLLILGVLLWPVLPSGSLRKFNAGILLMTLGLVFYSDLGADWSPYYRLTLQALRSGGERIGHVISVNGIGHQTMLRIRDKEPFYHAPYLALGDRARYRRVLVIGAGSGSDVAFALSYGAEHVDAVEIDPGIVSLGRVFHPERPYADSRVHVTIDDARDFLRQPGDPYDLVVFGLPDSLTLSSAVSNLRLESFLFTSECFAAVKSRLTPGGVVVLYNYYRQPWLVEKLGGMLRDVFGRDPRIFVWTQSGYVATLFAGPGAGHLLPLPEASIPLVSSPPPPAHDDWPFLYVVRPSLPSIYIRFMAFVLAASLIALWLTAPKGTLRAFDPPLFFMGAAFMLLETCAVVRLSLLFGGTWRVNAAVFTGVLLMVLAAIVVRRRCGPLRVTGWAVALGVSLVINGFLPIQDFAMIPFGGWLAAVLAMVPIMIANVIFADLFAGATAPHVALASNILGAIAGGLLEYTSMYFGYRALLIPVALLYAAALLWPRRGTARALQSEYGAGAPFDERR